VLNEFWLANGDAVELTPMATITIELDDELARHVEESARREHKSVSVWLQERVKADSAATLAALEAVALKNGYPPGWTTLYASLADDESFVAPKRGNGRSVTSLD
jgi:hypothetical protein